MNRDPSLLTQALIATTDTAIAAKARPQMRFMSRLLLGILLRVAGYGLFQRTIHSRLGSSATSRSDALP